MPTVSFDGLSLSELAQTLTLQPSKHRPTHSKLGRSPVHFRDWHMVLEDDKI